MYVLNMKLSNQLRSYAVVVDPVGIYMQLSVSCSKTLRIYPCFRNAESMLFDFEESAEDSTEPHYAFDDDDDDEAKHD